MLTSFLKAEIDEKNFSSFVLDILTLKKTME